MAKGQGEIFRGGSSEGQVDQVVGTPKDRGDTKEGDSGCKKEELGTINDQNLLRKSSQKFPSVEKSEKKYLEKYT